ESNFQPNRSRLAAFHQKITSDDAFAEFHSTDLRKVRCSACSKWVTMWVLYDIRRWRDLHSGNLRCHSQQQRSLRTPSLVSYGFGVKALSLRSNPSPFPPASQPQSVHL